MGYPKLAAVSCLAALAGLACERDEAESAEPDAYSLDPVVVRSPVEPDAYRWEWEEADADADQRVLREEWDREVAMFDRLDTDDDGVVSQEEVERAIDVEEIYERVNGDRSPGLNRDEVRGRLFDVLDEDGDGSLEQREWPWARSR